MKTDHLTDDDKSLVKALSNEPTFSSDDTWFGSILQETENEATLDSNVRNVYEHLEATCEELKTYLESAYEQRMESVQDLSCAIQNHKEQYSSQWGPFAAVDEQIAVNGVNAMRGVIGSENETALLKKITAEVLAGLTNIGDYKGFKFRETLNITKPQPKTTEQDDALNTEEQLIPERKSNPN